ncbi:hypothetical protein BC834DRAFT_49343 [Gloeopeniophorella convolvens]|nr:hypothetical protein BC834DRAFT_49343 [Gloeopeniophorella convolvens]
MGTSTTAALTNDCPVIKPLGTIVFEGRVSFASFLSEEVVELSFFGVFTTLIALSTYMLCRKGLQDRANALMLTLTLVMYTASVTHMTKAYQTPSTDVSMGPSTRVLWFSNFGFNPGLSEGVTELLNIVLSDLVTMWRAWIMWGRPRTILVTSAGLSALTLGAGVVNLVASGGIHSSGAVADPFVPITPAGVTSELVLSGLSLVSNLWAWGLIAWKSWLYMQHTKGRKSFGGDQVKTSQTLSFLLGIGGVYILYWAFILIANTFPPEAADSANAALTRAIVHVAGIYPTLVVIIVSSRGNYLESRLDEDPGLSQPWTIVRRREHLANLLISLGSDQRSAKVSSAGEWHDSHFMDTSVELEFGVVSQSPHRLRSWATRRASEEDTLGSR